MYSVACYNIVDAINKNNLSIYGVLFEMAYWAVISSEFTYIYYDD